MKKILLVVVIVLIAAVLIKIFTTKPDSAGQQPTGGRGGSKGPVTVQAEDVRFGKIQQKREFNGTIKASYTYIIASKVSGRLINLSRRIGDYVKKNEIIGQIEDVEYQNAVDEADAQCRVSMASVFEAKAVMANTEKEVARIKELVAKGVSSQADFDAISTQLVTQKSRVDLAIATAAQRDAALAQARTRLGYTKLLAPQSGFVATRHADGGSLLNVNSAVLTIIGIDTIFVEIPVTERDYSLISKGQHASISVDALPGRKFTGRVRNMAPVFQTSTRTAVAEIAVANDSLLLKPGMFAQISLVLADKDSAQIIPFAAIVSRNQKSSVFIVNEGKAQLIPIVTGVIDKNTAEILEPVLGGKVITLGNHLLADGTPVIIEGEKSGKGDRKKSGESGSKEKQGEGDSKRGVKGVRQ